ncbi:MAG TPA: hypothetical protein VI256_11250 [Roseiarcus sp.]
MNQIVPFHGNAVALAAGGRLNVAAMVKHYLAPFESAVPFADLIERVKRNSAPRRRGKNEAPSAAIAIRRATANHVQAIRKAQHYLGIAMRPPNEADVRQILGVMFGAFHAEPTATSELLVDVLVMELMADDLDRPFALPAIMAAARDMWSTLSTPPNIAEFLVAARKHQQRLDGVFKELGDTLGAICWADDIIAPERPVDESDKDYIPFEPTGRRPTTRRPPPWLYCAIGPRSCTGSSPSPASYRSTGSKRSRCWRRSRST